MTMEVTVSREGVDLLDIGIGIFDADFKLSFCNSAFRALRDYPDGFCTPGVTVSDLLRFNAERGDYGATGTEAMIAELMGEIRSADSRERERTMADGQVLGITYRRTSDGGLVISYHDRTAERQAQHALRRSEERYTLVSEAAEEGLYDWDITGATFFASPRLRGLLGKISDTRGSRDWVWDDLVHPDDLELYRDTLKRHLAGENEAWRCEYRLKSVTGAWIWVSDHGKSIRDDSGRAVRMVAAVRDITDRMERDAALAASEERYALVARATSDGIYDWDVTNDVLFVSDNLTGILDADFSNHSSSMWAERVHPDDYPGYISALKAHFRGESDSLEHDYRVQARGGGFLWVHDHGVGVRDSRGRVTRLVGAVSDITNDIAQANALRASEERYAVVTEAISDWLFEYDFQTGKSELSEQMPQHFGFDSRIIDVADWLELVHPDDRDAYDASIHALVKSGVDQSEIEYRVRGSDGRYTWLRQFGIVKRNEDGWASRLIGTCRNIDDIKEIQEQAERARARLAAALATISDGLLVIDGEGRVELWNDRYVEIFSEAAGGADMSDVIVKGRPFFEMIRHGYNLGMFKPHPDGADAWVEERQRGWDTPRWQIELELANGSWILQKERTMPDGARVAVYNDITAFKAKQAEIEKQAEILELTLENMVQGISLVDSDLKTVAFNTKFLELLDFPPDEFKRGFTMEQAFRFNAARGEYGAGDQDAQVKSRLELAAKFQAHRFERKKPDGTVIEVVGNPTEGGGFVSTYTDITALKEREAQIIEARDAAEAALKELRQTQDRLVQSEKLASLGQLTAGIAHEIKNPLNFVINFAKLTDELLSDLTEVVALPVAQLDADDREEAEDLLLTIRENLSKINEHGTRADSIVKNMLMHSRQGPGQSQMSDLNAIAEEAANLAYHGAKAENSGSNVRLTTDLDPTLGKIECFPQDLMRVFLNLIGNGIYAAQKRQEAEGGEFSPTVHVSTHGDGKHIEVRVRDNGSGVPQDVIEKIFTPFFTTKPTGEGTGLGLSLSYDIVTKQHGGTLEVDSQQGQHTTFTVSLPRENQK